MNKVSIIKQAEQFAKKLLSKEGTGHDWYHVERVRNNALAINKKEKTDQFIIDLAVLLHDVGDRKVIKKDEDDYSIAETFLLKQDVSSGSIEEIMTIIKHMSFSKSFGAKKRRFSKEFYVVQDADRLDAIGAIGIARAFAFGGSKGRLIYDPSKKIQTIKSTRQYKQGSSSTLHHFDEKLFKLRDLMNTKEGKRIAKERHLYMKEFVKQFLAEWEGKR